MQKNMETSFAKFLRKTTEYLIYLFVFLLPWQTKFILQPAETAYSEISLYLSHALLLVILILFLVQRAQEKECDEECRPVLYPLIALAFFSFVSIFFAPDKFLAFYHYFIFLSGLSLFFVIRAGTTSHSYQDPLLDKVNLIYSLLASVFLSATLGIYQFLTQSTFAFKYLGLASHNPFDLGTAVVETASGRWLRAYGGLDHPNILGGVLAVSLIFAAYLLAKKKMLNTRRDVWSSIFLFVFYFVALYALFFTFSRSAWLALAVGFIVLLIVFIVNQDKWMLGRFLALMIFSIFLIGIAAFPFQDLLSVRVNVQTRLEQKSINERLTYISEAKELASKNIFTGVGVGNYSLATGLADGNKKAAWDYQPVHNSFLLILVENGIFSFLSFLVFIFFFIKRGRGEKFMLPIIAAIFILMMLDHWLISLPFGLLFLSLLLGLI